jgi:hypothetical protein
MFGRHAKYCHIFSSSPALAISSLNIASASLVINNFSSVTSPRTLIARPGPGNGCLHTDYEEFQLLLLLLKLHL